MSYDPTDTDHIGSHMKRIMADDKIENEAPQKPGTDSIWNFIDKKTLRILILSDYNANTGYGVVMNNLVKHWKKQFGNTDKYAGIIIHICAINWLGTRMDDGKLKTVYQEDNFTVVFSAVYSTPVNSMPESIDPFGRHGYLWVLQHSNDDDPTDDYPRGYDGVFILQDIGVVNSMVPMLEQIQRQFREQNKPNFKSIFYFPVDCELLPRLTTNLHFFDLLITYNEYSRKQVLRHRPELSKKLKVIPHGVDKDSFYPLHPDLRPDFRKEYFGEANAKKFIIINLNRNQPRKDIPCTIAGFMEYKKTNPDAFLYLHMNPADEMGWELNHVIEQTNLVEGEDFMFPPLEKKNKGFSTAELNKIYNACDVYVTTTLGEGWGLGVTEAMACGLPVICPMHTSFTEIGDHGKRVYALESLYPICSNTDNIWREQCDYQEVAERLEEVYTDLNTGSARVDDKVEASLNYVRGLHWPIVAAKFVEYFKQMF